MNLENVTQLFKSYLATINGRTGRARDVNWLVIFADCATLFLFRIPKRAVKLVVAFGIYDFFMSSTCV